MVAVSSKDHSGAQTERVRCPSRIDSVVVYARGAVVTRRVEIRDLPATAIDLIVDAITPLAEPGSFRVEVEGDREVLGVVTELEIPEDERSEGELTREITAATREIARLVAERARLDARRRSVASAQPEARLTKKKGFEDPGARARNLVSAQALLTEIERALDESIVAIDRTLIEQRKGLRKLEIEAAQREGRAVARKHHPELRAVIRLAAQDAPVQALLLSYGVAEARWWPTYAVHLTDGARRAELFVEALVAQATFEDWKDVSLALSTADKIRDVRLPELSSLRLGRAQEPKKRGFREPPSDLDQLFAAYDDAIAGTERKPAPIPPALRQLQAFKQELLEDGNLEAGDEAHGSFSEEITGVGWANELQVRD